MARYIDMWFISMLAWLYLMKFQKFIWSIL
jgi:hypothetical protein